MKILSISDKIDDLIHSPAIVQRFGDVDLVLSCGDLPYHYLEYIVTVLAKPLYFVYGNHAQRQVLQWDGSIQTGPGGCVDLHRRVVNHNGLLIAGLEGSMRYRPGDHQYTEVQMRRMVRRMAVPLALNKLRYGRALDILITHAPPLGIHDGQDLCHRGFGAFLTFMDRYRPRYLMHGHTHLYRSDAQRVTQYKDTTVINTYGHQIIEIDETSFGPGT